METSLEGQQSRQQNLPKKKQERAVRNNFGGRSVGLGCHVYLSIGRERIGGGRVQNVRRARNLGKYRLQRKPSPGTSKGWRKRAKCGAAPVADHQNKPEKLWHWNSGKKVKTGETEEKIGSSAENSKKQGGTK